MGDFTINLFPGSVKFGWLRTEKVERPLSQRKVTDYEKVSDIVEVDEVDLQKGETPSNSK